METTELTEEQRSARMAVPVWELGLAKVSAATLRKAGFLTLADVFAHDAREFENMKGVGPKAMDVLRSRFRDADVQWGSAMGVPPSEPKPDEPVTVLKPKSDEFIEVGHTAIQHLEAEIPLTLQEVLGIPRGLLRPEYTKLLRQTLKRYYPRIPLSPTVQLIQVNGCGAFVCKPDSEELRFRRKLTLLCLMHLAAEDLGVTAGDSTSG